MFKQTYVRWIAVTLAAVCIAGAAFWAGKRSVPPVATYTESKQWNMVAHIDQKQWQMVAVNSRERVVTRWLRPDGTPRKEQVREAATEAKQETKIDTAVKIQESVRIEHKIEFQRPRWNISALGGLDLKARRHFGVSVSYRIAGPVSVGAWTVPTAKMGGVSIGLTF